MFCKFLISIFVLCAVNFSYANQESQGSYFSERWTNLYSTEDLENQPKWRLAEDQPQDSAYEVRTYDAAYWISSSEPCWDHEQTSILGYFNIYFFLMGFNYQRLSYPLTFPAITRVQLNNNDDANTSMKKSSSAVTCSDNFHAMVYLPVDSESEIATAPDESLHSELIPQRVVYVKEYSGNNTGLYCNQQASQLTQHLIEDGVKFIENDWYCAKYPGKTETEGRYEVWVVGEKKQEQKDMMLSKVDERQIAY